MRGLIRKNAGDWIVTLFLVNNQKQQDRFNDEQWLFQPELVAEAADGGAVFLKRQHFHDPQRADAVTVAEVGYFNSLRELGGSRRLVDDSVRSLLRETVRRGLANRKRPMVKELNSRLVRRTSRTSSTCWRWALIRPRTSNASRPRSPANLPTSRFPSTCCSPRTWCQSAWT